MAFLEEPQKEALALLVEAARNVPSERRQKFYFSHEVGEVLATLVHEGLPGRQAHVFAGDLEALHEAGLVRLVETGDGSGELDVRPEGYRLYQVLRRERGLPEARADDDLRRRLVTIEFRENHPVAFRKWQEAEMLLWSSDSLHQLSTIGHLCREALQALADDLVRSGDVRNAPSDPTKTVSRIRAVLSQRGAGSATVRALHVALLEYWGAVNDVVQRQEHAGVKERDPLVWEDGRRTVLYTALVMAELSK